MVGSVTAWLGVVAAVGRRPRLWVEAVRQGRRLARPGGRDWFRFRMATAYGDPRARPRPADVVAWLEWSRRSIRPGRPSAV